MLKFLHFHFGIFLHFHSSIYKSQSDGYSQIMRICDVIKEEQRYCLGYVSKGRELNLRNLINNETKIHITYDKQEIYQPL